MNVTILSAFRNSVATLPRYFAQVWDLWEQMGARDDGLNLILGYGDSTDDTDAMLAKFASKTWDAVTVDVSHGGPVYGSIENPQRFAQLAVMGNALLDELPLWADVAIWLESDLVWEPATMLRLIDHLADVPAVAPMVMDGPQSFYDVWGFRRNGKRFTKTPPYHANLNGELLQVDSAGSCLVMRAGLAHQVRATKDEAIVGTCKAIYQAGGSVWCDPGAIVWHP